MRPSPRMRFGLVLAIGFAGFVLVSVAALALRKTQLMWLAALPWLCAGVFVLSIRCPSCGRHATHRILRLRSAEIDYWGIPGDSCDGCSAPLR